MFTPDMDAIRDWVSSGGMASDLDQAARDALVKDHPDLLRDFQNTFGTTSGARVLDYLAKSTVLRPPADYRLPAGEALAYCNVRQGQNQTFALIVELMELGKQLERTPHDRSQLAGGGTGLGPSSDGDTAGGWSAFDPGGDIAI